MGNFHHGADRNKGRGDFKKSWGNKGGDRGGRDDRRDRGEVTMHRAVCSDCGKNCEVPFNPSGDKPVFCNECFGAKKGDNRGNDRGFDRGNDRGTKEKYVSTPRQPVQINNDETKKQFSEILNRLDKLASILEMSLVKNVEPVKEVKAKKEVAEKAIKAPAKAAAKKVVAKKKK